MKSSKVEECIICGEVPCICYVKKPKPRAKKSSILCGPVAPAASDLAVVAEFEQQLHTRFQNAKKTGVPDSGLDFDTEQAVRNLANAGMLTDVDLVKYRHVITSVPSPDVDRRLADWRKRNGLA